jgi:hypothetical protein
MTSNHDRHDYLALEEPIRELYYMARMTWDLVENSRLGGVSGDGQGPEVVDGKLHPASMENIIMDAINRIMRMSHNLLETYYLDFEKGEHQQ